MPREMGGRLVIMLTTVAMQLTIMLCCNWATKCRSTVSQAKPVERATCGQYGVRSIERIRSDDDDDTEVESVMHL